MSDLSYLDLPHEMLADLGFNLSYDRMDTWITHRLWRKCPVVDCEWCRKEKADVLETLSS